MTLPHQSAPAGLAFYPADGELAFWQGGLLVALSGSQTTLEPAGYAVDVWLFAEGAPTGQYQRLAPVVEAYAVGRTLAAFSLEGLGFFPNHPTDIAVSREGWVYVSEAEGAVWRFRARPIEPVESAPAAR